MNSRSNEHEVYEGAIGLHRELSRRGLKSKPAMPAVGRLNERKATSGIDWIGDGPGTEHTAGLGAHGIPAFQPRARTNPRVFAFGGVTEKLGMLFSPTFPDTSRCSGKQAWPLLSNLARPMQIAAKSVADHLPNVPWQTSRYFQIQIGQFVQVYSARSSSHRVELSTRQMYRAPLKTA
jgi:hypothetical protein